MRKTRNLLLVCALLLTAVATRPAKSDDCFIVHECVACPGIPEARLCTKVICTNAPVSVSCTSCLPECILPG